MTKATQYTHADVVQAAQEILAVHVHHRAAFLRHRATGEVARTESANKRAAIATYCARCKLIGYGAAMAQAVWTDVVPDKDQRKGVSFSEVYGVNGAGILNRHDKRDMLAAQWAEKNFAITVGQALSDIRTGTDYAKALGKAVRGLLDRHLARPDEVRKMVTAAIKAWQQTQDTPVTPAVAQDSKLALAV